MTVRDMILSMRSTTLRSLTVLALVAGVMVAAPAQEQAAAAPPDPQVQWHPCGDGFECATARVPLDHGDPRATIQLRLIRLPAENPQARIGSLFINPGGPGGSGVDVVRGAAALFPAPVRAHYDIVGFDPRGIMRSTALRCFGAFNQALRAAAPFPFPVTADEQAQWEAHDRDLADACDRRGGRMLDHMTTADVARDLDLLRAAVGDDRLNYIGLSYGSQLGNTYANLFPDRVGAVVLDGVLDPIAWTTGRGGEAATVPFSTRLRSHEGAHDTLGEFLRLCDEAGPPQCLLAPGAADRFEALAEGLRAQPVPIVDPVTGEELLLTYAVVVSVVLQSLYDPVAWPELAALLAALEASLPQQAIGERYAALQAALPDAQGLPAYPGILEGAPGVFCTDSDNPPTHGAWATAAGLLEDEFPHFAWPWTFLSSVCAFWPGAGERYAGPWDAETANTVLLVGNLFDPATPYHGAEVVEDLLPNSRLLTYEGWGHTATLLSPCVTDAVTAYLVDGVVPPEGAACPAPASPFTAVPPPPGT